MTLPIPLTVRLVTDRADRHITADLHDLSFRTVVPGGFASARMSLNRPLTLQPDEIGYYGKVYIYDERNGETVWEGRLEDPGRSAGSDGELWELVAVGPAAHTHDRKVPLIYVDTSLERWRPTYLTTRIAQAGIEEFDPDTPSLVLRFQAGITINTNHAAVMIYRAIAEAGQKLSLVGGDVDNGATTANWENRIGCGVGYFGAQIARHTQTWSATTSAMFCSVGGSNPITLGENVTTVRIVRVAANYTSGQDVWGQWSNMRVRSVLFDVDGTEITSGYTLASVKSHEVVKDLLGRLLTKYDGPGATVETSSYINDQCAYPDGATPADVLDDLMLLEPERYWAAWESNSAGKHRFEWRLWPTTVRYEADVNDGYTSTGSAEELYNAVSVRYRDRWGFIRTVRRTSAVPVLDDAGLTREAFVDLGDEIASPTNAIQVGDRFLADHASPPNAGALTIARPIYDRNRGTSVMPWEIRPGRLIRVRGVLPNTNSLNVTDRDGVTVFRVISVDYDTSSASARLELDSYPPGVARTLAALAKNRITRRR
jgi:hypothetical protein